MRRPRKFLLVSNFDISPCSNLRGTEQRSTLRKKLVQENMSKIPRNHVDMQISSTGFLAFVGGIVSRLSSFLTHTQLYSPRNDGSKVRNKFIKIYYIQNLNTKRPLPDRTNRITYRQFHGRLCQLSLLSLGVDISSTGLWLGLKGCVFTCVGW